jgi:OOP family OmpA-OmpF porin
MARITAATREVLMRSRIPFAGLVAVAFFAAGVASAEPMGRHFEIAPIGGFTIFDGDFRYPGSSTLTDDLYAGLRAGWQYNSWLGIEGAFGYAPTAEDVAGGRDVNLWHGSGNLMFTPWAARWGGPYLFAGFGTGEFSADSADALSMGLAELGGGVRMWMTDVIGLRFEARTLNWMRDNSSKTGNTHVMLGGGLIFALGATARDTDGDGVSDRKDRCPDTPKGATVTTDGCPTDGDGDGVCDGVDQCADTPKGARVDERGCPLDSDGDGVFDGLDQCENSPRGCTVDEKGCPKDTDGDGVCDGLDRCDQTPAGLRVDPSGCPIEVIEKETELLDTGMIRLQDVNFETGKAVLAPSSFQSLDIVGTLLKSWIDLRIEIGGHTDSRGSATANQKLSEARAGAVRTYLLEKYPELKDEQYQVKGYGESQPVVPNTGPENMTKNRRVEFKVLNRDVLRRESERRRMLQQNEAPADTTRR